MAKLTFICGEMGSGKTAHLIDSVKASLETAADSSDIVVMKSKVDTKNGNKLLSRNGEECDVDFCISENDDVFAVVSKEYTGAKKIFVDEAQFLSKEQIEQLLKITALLDIDVIAYGLRLNGDENFAGATRLLQVAHEITVLDSKCDICGEKQAIFSCLFKGDKVALNSPTILISDGTQEVNAKAVCAKCYYDSL